MFDLLRIVKAACAAECKPNGLIRVKKIKKYIYTSTLYNIHVIHLKHTQFDNPANICKSMKYSSNQTTYHKQQPQ